MSDTRPNPLQPKCSGISRRTFLADTGMGFTGLALGAMLFREGTCRAEGSDAVTRANVPHPTTSARQTPDGKPHFTPKADSVIWIFLCGGVSHMESFDPKPMLNKYAGKSADETPYAGFFDPQRFNKNLVDINPSHTNRKLLMGLNTGVKRYGECGLAVGDWFANIGTCADDLAVVRSLWTCHNDHGTQLTWHTGRHPREGELPTVGSWISYGLAR